MIKVNYLYHSGFSVELDKSVLVFDYYKGDAPVVPQDKKLVVFASHKHGDHFQLSTLKWGEEISENTRYFFGNDIKLSESYLERKGITSKLLERAERLHGGEHFELPQQDLKVETLRSTDEGVAFLVQTEGISIYHAGDLNYWYWEGEAKSWNDKMASDYRAEIDKIAGRHFDLAFVPLDSRLEGGYHLGMDYFLEKVDADMIFPMHMWEDYRVIEKYKKTETGRKSAGKIADISEQNREFRMK